MIRAFSLALSLLVPAASFAAEIPRLSPSETPLTPPASAAAGTQTPTLLPLVFATPLLRAAASLEAPALPPAATAAAAASEKPAFQAFTAQTGSAPQAEQAGNVVHAFFEHTTLDHAVGPSAAPVPAGPGAPRDDDRGRLKAFTRGMAVAGVFVAAEVAGSFIGHGASLRADALHSAIDWGVNTVGLLAIILARRHPEGRGWKKAEPVVGLVSTALVAMTAYELGSIALERFHHPVPYSGLATAAFALFGIGSHLAPALAIGSHRKDGVGTEGVFLHALTDAVGSLAVAAGGLAAWALGWQWIDPAVTAFVTLMVAHAALDLGRRSWKAWRALKK